jgi:hypothetical protein
MRALTTAASIVRHSSGALAEAFLLAILIAALLMALAPMAQPASDLSGAGTALAGKGGQGGGGRHAAMLTCAVSPDPASVGEVYTVTGTGYPTNHQFAVQVTNSYGTMVLFTAADESGAMSVSGFAAWPGGYTVTVVDNSLRKPKVIGGCGFDVQ